MRRVTILGSTGSVGQTRSICCSATPKPIAVEALVAQIAIRRAWPSRRAASAPSSPRSPTGAIPALKEALAGTGSRRLRPGGGGRGGASGRRTG